MGIIARQSFKASMVNYAGILLAFLNLFLLAPLFYSPRELGALRILLEFGAVISSFALIGTNYSINRFFPYFKSKDQRHNGFFFWVFLIPMVGYFIVLTALLFFKKHLLSFYKADIEIMDSLYPMLIVLVLFSLFQTVVESANANHGRIAVPNLLREVVLRSGIIFAGLLFYLDLIQFTISIWFIVGMYGLIVLLNLMYLRSLTRIHIAPDFKFLRDNPAVREDALRYTAWLFLGGITSLIVSKVDFIMISTTKNLEQTAIYSIGFYLALLIEIPKRTMLQISTPIIAEHMKNSEHGLVHKLYKQLANNQLLAASFLFLAIWINVDSIFEIMPNGEFYTTGKSVVFIIGIGRLIDMIGSSASPILANSQYYFWGLINSIVAIAVAIIANYLLIPVLGINGAAIATILTFFLSQGVSIAIIYNKLKIHPFTINQIKTLLVLIIFMGTAFTGKWFENPYFDGLVRTSIFIPLMFFVTYKLKVSSEMNVQFLKLINHFNKL